MKMDKIIWAIFIGFYCFILTFLQFIFVLGRIGEEEDFPGLSCKDIKDSQENSPNGEYWIAPSNSDAPFTVFCDMQTNGGTINEIQEMV